MAKLQMVGNAATVVMYTTATKLQKFAQHVIIHRLTSKEELKITKMKILPHKQPLVGFLVFIIDILYNSFIII